MRKVYWEELEEVKSTERMGYKKWIGSSVRFEYEGLQGYIDIIGYSNSRLKLKYVDNIYNMLIVGFKNARIGVLVEMHNTGFQHEIGDIISDDNRNFTIISRKLVKDSKNKWNKLYGYKCNKCGFDGGEHYSKGVLIKEVLIPEYVIKAGQGCACCSSHSRIVAEGINDIPTTAPWMVKYFQGGYDEAKRYSTGSHGDIYFKCPICNTKKDTPMAVYTLLRTRSIGCVCSDGISIPEKITTTVLRQLNINPIVQLSKRDFDWVGKYKYDYYIPSLNIIIETHGSQHPNTKYYKEGSSFDRFSTSKGISILQNDINKKELAFNNNIKEYIEIDCSKSDFEFIKENILSSRLSELFDLSTIDWEKCLDIAYRSAVIDTCNYYNSTNKTVTEMVKDLKIDDMTIRKYLAIGNKLGICEYDAEANFIKTKNNAIEIRRKLCSRKVLVMKDGEELGIFPSIRNLADNSLEMLGTKLDGSAICNICNGKRDSCKGYTFKYVI